jgi:hypothetical protein
MNQSDLHIEQASERRAGLMSFFLFAGLAIANWVVNSTSIIIENEREGNDFVAGQAWFIEGTSTLFILILFFAVVRLENKFPISSLSWKTLLPIHLAGSIVFSITHVLAMAFTREAFFPILFDGNYQFFSNVGLDFVYEYRKDVITYLYIILALTAFRTIESHRMEAAAARQEAKISHRITLKCGGRIMRLDAQEFVSAKAAGNYVEAKFGEGQHLARMTLAELEKLLVDAKIDATRVHRSWLINRRRIAEIKPTGEGDVTITLTNGDTIPGSRRFRDRLEAA